MVEDIEAFIVRAKAACYVGNGVTARSSRQGSHDLTYREGLLSYRDSYFGGTDFQGQETVWRGRKPLWSMVYHGFILRPDLIDAARAGATIKAALGELYREKRFLGGFSWAGPHGVYTDMSNGDWKRFQGRESIEVEGVEAYALNYSGGLTIP